ncbi:MAG: energy transducer TonB [Planctomycetota bacterium]
MNRSRLTKHVRSLLHHAQVVLGAAVLTVAVFLVLPLIQAISEPPRPDLVLVSADTAALPPPPPPPEPEPEEEQEDEKPPELQPDAPPLDLAQLELALDPGMGGGWTTAEFAIKLDTAIAGDGGGDGGLFALDDLDQKPRCVYKQSPRVTPQMRRKGGGTVYVAFVVDEGGRVQNPIVQESPDPIYDKPAVDAVRRWKFEPGKRSGQAVSSRMRVPITFKF